MSIIDQFMINRFGRMNWNIIKLISKIPFIHANVIYVKMDDPEIEKYKDQIKKNDKAMKSFKTQITKFKKEGKTRSYVISTIESELNKYSIDFRALPRLVYDVWDEIESNGS